MLPLKPIGYWKGRKVADCHAVARLKCCQAPPICVPDPWTNRNHCELLVTLYGISRLDAIDALSSRSLEILLEITRCHELQSIIPFQDLTRRD